MTCSWTCESDTPMLDRILTRPRSDPRSPNYGKHLSRSEVIDLFAPDNHSVAKVKRWLVSEGIDERRISQSANKQVSGLFAISCQVEE